LDIKKILKASVRFKILDCFVVASQLLAMTLLGFGCSKTEDAPQQFSSFDYRMDGSWCVPDVGVPSNSVSMTIADSTASSVLLTAPTPLINAGNFTYAISSTNFISSTISIIIGNETTSKIIAQFPAKPILELLSDKTAIYTIQSDGKIHALDHDGKNLWQADLSGFTTTHSILAENSLIAATDSAITAIDIHSGKSQWSYHTDIATARSLIYDNKAKNIIALLSAYNRGADDSIVCYNLYGQIRSRTGFHSTRIISNLCLCGKEREKIAFGYLKKPNDSDSLRTMHIGIYSGLESGNVKNTSDHELPYFATKISSNGPIVLTAGFYNGGGELESGIDAFSADDTIKLWQRRFTELVVTPVAVSGKFAYLTLSFSTKSIVPAKTIFYTLELSTGKALGELPIKGTQDVGVNGIPMPMNESGFMFSGIRKPVIYFLKP
jgi:hypothetical protein